MCLPVMCPVENRHRDTKHARVLKQTDMLSFSSPWRRQTVAHYSRSLVRLNPESFVTVRKCAQLLVSSSDRRKTWAAGNHLFRMQPGLLRPSSTTIGSAAWTPLWRYRLIDFCRRLIQQVATPSLSRGPSNCSTITREPCADSGMCPYHQTNVLLRKLASSDNSHRRYSKTCHSGGVAEGGRLPGFSS